MVKTAFAYVTRDGRERNNDDWTRYFRERLMNDFGERPSESVDGMVFEILNDSV